MPKFISRSGQFPAVAGSSAGFIERGGRETSLGTKSTIDRVLILAAILCAAGLVWQLTVLLMGHGATHKAEPVAVAKSGTASPVPADAAKSDQASVRVVYPVEGEAGTPKTTVKAGDAPLAPVPPPASSAALSAPTPAAPAAQPKPPVVPPSTPQAASLDPAPSAPPAALAAPPAAPQPLLAANPPPAIADAGAPSPAEPAPPAPAAQATALAEPVPAKPKASASGQVLNINNASAEALNHLPGAGHIGAAIVSHRPYRSVADLVKKRVLRREVFDQIKGQIAAE